MKPTRRMEKSIYIYSADRKILIGMSIPRVVVLVGLAITFLTFSPALRAQFSAVGGLDCNGFSKVQKPLKAIDVCTDPRGLYGGRFYDNGHYIGHDEPSVGFYSNAPHSGNNVQWEFTLPRERPLPATQSFENYIAFWFGMALCDPGSFPNGPCIPDSDNNTPFLAGSAFLEMQFYPPGFPPFINAVSCDLTHWCASLHINSLEVMSNGKLNPNCAETTNFAFIQRDGIPTGPPGPNTMNAASATPNAQTVLMNQGDRIRVTIKDTPDGLLTQIEDLTTGVTGFMVASAANGYQTTDPNTCAGTDFSFHPEFDTAKFGNFVPWAALQANVNFDVEIGHFEFPDGDADDVGCFPGPLLSGCIGADVDFDGTSYQADWPDGTMRNATSVRVGSVRGNGIGPLSPSAGTRRYDQPFPIIQIETDVSASEATCKSNGVGCVVPPVGAQFYPFYAFSKGQSNSQNDQGQQNDGSCSLIFGNFSGSGINNFGRDAQYGAPNLAWFFGTNSNGPQTNPCIPNASNEQ